MDLLVIGTASLDLLHLGEQTVSAAGGAGMYTAMAAHRAGADVTLFAPRPDPMPEILQLIAERVHWLGPRIEPSVLPRLEIAHHGGGKATLVDASWGAEAQLTPNYLPSDLSNYQFIHIAALSSAQRQLDFLHACRQRRANQISIGTYARVVQNEAAIVRTLFEQADLFFMNENEASGLFGSTSGLHTQANKLLFVTLGEQGALVGHEDEITQIPASAAEEFDPTGAGDTFCGATLAGLAKDGEVVDAARQATKLAASMIEQVGPAALVGNCSTPRKTRHRAYAYITHQNRLLVFTQPEAPEAGIQVPAGTVEFGERPEDAVMREAQEETGLEGLRLVRFLAQDTRDMRDCGRDEHQYRWFYHLVCDIEPPEQWTHGEYLEDGTLQHPFDFLWADMSDLPVLVANYDDKIPQLRESLKQFDSVLG